MNSVANFLDSALMHYDKKGHIRENDQFYLQNLQLKFFFFQTPTKTERRVGNAYNLCFPKPNVRYFKDK